MAAHLYAMRRKRLGFFSDCAPARASVPEPLSGPAAAMPTVNPRCTYLSLQECNAGVESTRLDAIATASMARGVDEEEVVSKLLQSLEF